MTTTGPYFEKHGPLPPATHQRRTRRGRFGHLTALTALLLGALNRGMVTWIIIASKCGRNWRPAGVG